MRTPAVERTATAGDKQPQKPLNYLSLRKISSVFVVCLILLDEAATLRKNITNSHFEKISSWERLSSREKSWQNAHSPVS